MRAITVVAAVAALAWLAAGVAFAEDSAYTQRDLDRCETLSESDEGPSVTLKCGGYRGLAIYFKEDDLRQSQQYGPIGKAWLDEAFETFGPFNHAGDRIEWRLGADGAAFATIVRWFVADPETTGEGDARYGEILVVSTVARRENPTSCVVGYVDALSNKDANILARRVADEEAKDFACGLGEPQWHGARGQLAGEPMRVLPGAGE